MNRGKPADPAVFSFLAKGNQMAIQELEKTYPLTLHYHFEGNNNSPGSAGYRSENPWQKMLNLRADLANPASEICFLLDLEFATAPDKSVWRLNLDGPITPSRLERTARGLLAEIEGMIDEWWPRDEVRVLIGDGVGVIREWSLTA